MTMNTMAHAALAAVLLGVTACAAAAPTGEVRVDEDTRPKAREEVDEADTTDAGAPDAAAVKGTEELPEEITEEEVAKGEATKETPPEPSGDSSPKTAKRRIENLGEMLDARLDGSWTIDVDARCRLEHTSSDAEITRSIELTQVKSFRRDMFEITLLCVSGECATTSDASKGDTRSGEFTVETPSRERNRVFGGLRLALNECRLYHGVAPPR
jgi:hypothetical protein